MTRPIAALVALVLLAAACGDDGAPGASPDEPSVTQGDGEQPDAEPDPQPDVDGEDAAGTEDEPADLTATDTGVTESAIRVGVVFPDTSVIGRDPGDLEAKFQVMVDSINDAGGIHGRDLEMTFHGANPLDPLSFDEACVDLVDDVQVFAAVGLFPLTTADCYGALNDTIVISAFDISPDQMASYTAPGITVLPHAARLVDARVAALVDGGVLSEGMKIAVHGADRAAAAHEQYLTALDAAGIDVVSDTVGLQTGEDQLALEAELQTLTEVWQSSDAEAVLASTPLNSQALLIAYNNSAIDLPILLPEGPGVSPSLLQDQFGLDLTPFENATALVEGVDQATKYETGQDGVRECVDRFQTATGEDVALDESRNNLAPTIMACQVFEIFAQIATAAGPELTTESFAEAAESFGPIEVTDLRAASTGPDKFDLSDTAGVIAVFNPETVQFEAVE
ncbi:MAG: hypothetical protein DHS20C19_04310 [Acidimicrobiales bacterium]|nr:MAG: hypothetical protein DHS20C19_04310 [Acidimicrobiales bacterium]